MSIGMSKHRKSGKCPKSPKLRHRMAIDANKNDVLDKSAIKNPKLSIKDLMKKK